MRAAVTVAAAAVAVTACAPGAVTAPACAPAAPTDSRDGPAGVSSATPAAGRVRFVKAAEADFDRFTRRPTPAQKCFMRRHYWRMRTYSPYFDSRVKWSPGAWTYKDLYAIYPRSDLPRRHPEWILRDDHGRRLYIPFDCGGGRCPQYAADVGDRGFRRWWIRSAAQKLRGGRYRGLFIDDVNMLRRVSNGLGVGAVPRDDRTGRPMSERRWRAYVADFTTEIRRAFPRPEIVHNSLWFAGRDQYVQRQVRSADFLEFERGFGDEGLQRGAAPGGIDSFMREIDWVHGRGRGVVLDGHAVGEAAREYGLAGLLLISTAGDALGNDPGSTPADWWRGYEVTLGAPLGRRYRWHGLLRRDFARGLVLLNEPGAPVRAVKLSRPLRRAGGQEVGSVQLGAASGVVLRFPPHHASVRGVAHAVRN